MMADLLGDLEFEIVLRHIVGGEEMDRRLRSLLANALRNGNFRTVFHLLGSIFSRDRLRTLQQIEGDVSKAIDQNGQKALHWATAADSLKCFKLLNSQLCASDRNGLTASHIAASNCSLRLIRPFVENPSIRATDSRSRNELHYAATYGNVIGSEKLLQNGMALDSRDCLRQTALMFAAAVPMSTELLSVLSVQKPLSVSLRNDKGHSSLHLAVLADNRDALRFFLKTSPPDLLDNERRTPLHYAAVFGRLEAVRILLNSGADVNVRDCLDAAPAHYAALSSLATLKILLEHSREEVLDKDQRTSFMWAVAAQNEYTVRAFLDGHLAVSAQPNAVDRRRQTALHLAALTGNVSICKLLISYGWSHTFRDRQSATPVHLAAGNGHTNLLLYFKRGFSIDETDGSERLALSENVIRSPLFYAALGAKSTTISVMVTELQADVNRRDLLHQTALHCAAFVGAESCCSVLRRLGCDPTVRDVNDRTAADIARQRGKTSLANSLESDIDSVEDI